MKNILCCILAFGCTAPVYAQQPARHQLLLHEIMANPPAAPALLPDVRYIELFNASSYPQDLYEWKISDGSSTAIIQEHFVLQPDSLVILCPANGAAALSSFGKSIGLSRFPQLRVNGDQLWLMAPDHSVIHAVKYHRSWYKNDFKSSGGWSLEMIDAHNPCGGAGNWTASSDNSGGTPGLPNSVAGKNGDETMPRLLHAYTTDSLHIMLVFDEPLDSLTAAQAAHYNGSDGLVIEQATPQAPFFTTVLLKLKTPIPKNKTYHLKAKAIYDCSGNSIGETETVKTGRHDTPGNADLVINEIMVSPRDNGAEYLELYNRSTRIVNAWLLHIANRNSAGNLTTFKTLSAENILIFPGDYVVITDNAMAVKQQYLVKFPDAVLEIPSLPSLPDASGKIVVINEQGDVVDELHYDARWHFNLITNPKGVALERIDYNQATQEQSNWHSAAASAGYGTPTYQNSQFKINEQLQGTVQISPSIFSPDNDGYDDFLTIAYQFPESGYVCNITVYDNRGRTVRHIVRNGICGTTGYYRWDGLDEHRQPLSRGVYVILTELYTLKGKTKKMKQAVTLARRR